MNTPSRSPAAAAASAVAATALNLAYNILTSPFRSSPNNASTSPEHNYTPINLLDNAAAEPFNEELDDVMFNLLGDILDDDEEDLLNVFDEDDDAEAEEDDEVLNNIQLIEIDLENDDIPYHHEEVLLDKNGYGKSPNKRRHPDAKNRKKKGKRNMTGRRPKRRRIKVVNLLFSNDDNDDDDDDDNVEQGVDDSNANGDTEEVEMDQVELRRSISFMYTNTLKLEPPENWRGKDGTMRKIMKRFELNDNKRWTVMRVVKDTYECSKLGVEYDPTVAEGRGRDPIIKPGSEWEQMIADHKESGLSFEDTTQAVNEVRQERNLRLWRVGAIKGVIAKMPKRVVKLIKKAQGSYDPDSHWAKARHGFSLQLLIRTKKISVEEVKVSLGLEANDNLPDQYTYVKLTPIHPEAVAWFDEVHRKCFNGDLGTKVNHQYQFPRNEEGELDPNGNYQEPAKECTFKYNSETRLQLGVAEKRDANNNRVGYRLPVLDYTGEKMVSIVELRGLDIVEIQRVKKEGKREEWVHTDRAEGTYYKEDEPCMLPCITEAHSNTLKEININNLEQLKQWIGNGSSAAIKQLYDLVPRSSTGRKQKKIGEAKLKAFATALAPLELVDGTPPPVIDYRKMDHPYKEKYGQNWKKMINQSPTHSKVTNVCDMVEHMVKCCTDFFAGTPHEDSWYFYHDALSIMTAKECVAWMKKKDYLKHWILPELGLNDNVGSYGGRPVGSSPEFMPLDASLNKDVHESVNRNCLLSRRAMKMMKKNPKEIEEDVRTFSISTPKRAALAYKRIYHPATGVAPTSKRILEDIDGAWDAFRVVADKKGVYVHGLAEKTGRRYMKIEEKTGKHGGSRKAIDPSIAYLKKTNSRHPDVRELMEEARRYKEAEVEVADEEMEVE